MNAELRLFLRADEARNKVDERKQAMKLNVNVLISQFVEVYHCGYVLYTRLYAIVREFRLPVRKFFGSFHCEDQANRYVVWAKKVSQFPMALAQD